MSIAAYPLSPLQEGLFFHWLLDRHSGTDIEQVVGDLREVIEPTRLERAWNSVIAAFSTLRTAFRWEGLAAPVQFIDPSVTCPFTFEDLRGLGSEDRERRLAEYLKSDRCEGFDLTRAPAMRVALFQMEDTRFRMIWSFHHVIIDGRSFEVVLNAVFAAYQADNGLSVTDRPYRDYIDWIGHQDLAAVREFWRAKLRGFTAPTPVPLERAVPVGQNRWGERATRLSAEVTRNLRKLAAREGLSLNTVLMGAWAMLLSRYTGETDIVFGVTKTTRRGTIPNADEVVGIFLATLPFRIVVDPSLPTAQWLKRVREQWLALRGNEHLPLTGIKQESQLSAAAPLFDTLMVFENYQFGTRLSGQGGSWACRHFSILEQTGFPLSLLAYGDEELLVKLEFDPRRLDEATVERMMGHVTTVLSAWADDVTMPLGLTPVLTARERSTVLVEWNQTSQPYPATTPLAAQIEAQVRKTPDAPAVTFGETTITYRELNVRANRLARELVRFGGGPDSLVGLAVERSIDMVVGLLAIVKSGAAYVPLDPSFPQNRLSYMVKDSGLNLIVTQEGLRGLLPTFSGQVVSVDGSDTVDGGEEDLEVAVGPEHLGYVIYTSGSTGQPKGVEIPRGALTNLLWSMRDWLRLTQRDRLLAVTTMSFDIAGVDIWLPLLVGAQVVVVSREEAADGLRLRQRIQEHDITFLQATPVTWRLLLEAGWTGKADLQIVCTGEALPNELSVALVPLVARLWNLYGPTETTIWSTGYPVTKGDEPVLIGRPVANTQCYILDQNLLPVPIGAAGELYIGGDGLARGYLGRPELTAEKFLIDPFVTKPGARMYRTGDLARHRPDGNIECLGRTDHQVKIRGYRIELGEIEAVMKAYHGVKQAVVVAREDIPGEKQLVGYVVAQSEQLDIPALRNHMKQSLPQYMVPVAMVVLDEVPLTATGKIDRRALPAVDRSLVQPEAETVAARTHVEQQLSDIWRDLFGVEQVGVNQDFFELGGYSILAVKMMARIHSIFGKRLALNTLFEAPTIAELARHIEDDDRTLGSHTLVSIRVTGSRPPVFWIPGGAALGLFRLHHIVTRLHPEQPVYGLGSTPPRTVRDIETVEQRARNYLELVRRVRPHGPYCLVGFCAGGLVAFEMAQQLVAAGEVVALVGMINSGVPGYPEKIVDRLLIKVERLRHQLAVAGAGGKNLVAYLSQKREEYSRAAKQDRALAEAAREVSVTGFRPDDEMHNEVLLAETVKIFRNYQPRYFPGRISLFISDDEASAGVSRRLDSRYAWARYAREHEVRRFPGGHDDLIEMTHGALFSEVLHAALEDALAGVKAASGGPTSEVVGQGSGQQSREDENATPEGG